MLWGIEGLYEIICKGNLDIWRKYLGVTAESKEAWTVIKFLSFLKKITLGDSEERFVLWLKAWKSIAFLRWLLFSASCRCGDKGAFHFSVSFGYWRNNSPVFFFGGGVVLFCFWVRQHACIGLVTVLLYSKHWVQIRTYKRDVSI